MVGTPLLIGPEERAALDRIRIQAAQKPIDMRGLSARLATPEGKRAHVEQMTAQTVAIPLAYLVTFSVEIGHPGGAARHMSMSVQRRGRVPAPEAVWIIAEALGFVGSLRDCDGIWPEELAQGKAINVVQLISHGEGGRA